jgi:Protein of unknwon function (DUF3008)
MEVKMPAKRGEVPKSNLKEPSTSMYKHMSENELDKFAHTKRSKLPARKSTKKAGRKTGRR